MIVPFKNAHARVVVTNRSQFSARNPGVRIRLVGFMNVPGVPGWSSITVANMVGVTEFQWDGGMDEIIHGNWSRPLPEFRLLDAQVNPDVDRCIIVTVVADGIQPKSITLPVRVLEHEGWSEYMREISSRTANWDGPLADPA